MDSWRFFSCIRASYLTMRCYTESAEYTERDLLFQAGVVQCNSG